MNSTTQSRWGDWLFTFVILFLFYPASKILSPRYSEFQNDLKYLILVAARSPISENQYKKPGLTNTF